MLDLSRIFTYDFDLHTILDGLHLLHRLECEAQRDSPAMLETLPEVFTKEHSSQTRFEVFFLLFKKDLYPHLRLKILEHIVKETDMPQQYKLQDIKSLVTLEGKGETLVLLKSDSYSSNFVTLPTNARIALAHHLKRTDVPRAHMLFSELTALLQPFALFRPLIQSFHKTVPSDNELEELEKAMSALSLTV